MSFDALALHAVKDELADSVLGGRVDAVRLLDDRSIGLEIYAGRRVFVVISANPSDPCLYVTRDRPRRETEAVTPLLLLLRKYVRGGRITDVTQPRLERLLTLHISTKLEDGSNRSVEVTAELMGRRSNVLLIDEDGAILDALLRLPPSVNPARPLLPHLRYVIPPPEMKTDPQASSLGDILRSRAESMEGEAWRVVMNTVAGFSPLAAREAIARAESDSSMAASKVASWTNVANAIREITAPLENGRWEPSAAWRGGAVVDYAPYPIHQFADAEVRRYENMSEALVAIGGARRATKAAPFATLRKPLLEAIESRIDVLRRKRSSLERSLAMSDRADSLREAGEAILASASQIKEGDASFTWEGRRIDLYPSLTPVENAQAYFRQYTDARDAKRVVPPLLDEVASELEYLDDMALHVEETENEREISAIRRELEEANVVPRSRPAKRAAAPQGKQSKGHERASAPNGVVRKLSIDGAELLVGGSAEGNETTTFRLARPEDIWLHARGRPGSHVILRTNGKEVPDRWIERAAEIAAAHSAGREDTRVEVDYTLRKHVRKIAGALPGRVTYRNETTITVSPGRGAVSRRETTTVRADAAGETRSQRKTV